MADISVIDHIISSEKYRYETFSNLLEIPSITRHQLALAGFIYRDNECLCPQCGIEININNLDINYIYPSNYFRKLHREKIFYLGKRCRFLLCQSGTNIDDLHPPLPSKKQEKPQWDDAEQPEFNDYITRYQTFDTWPYFQQVENSFLTPSTMAEHGFYFSGPNDGVTCFYCGNTLVSWSEVIHSKNENIVQLEHARFFPCRFITYTAGGKFVANADYFHIVSDQERRFRNPMSSKPVMNTNKPQSIDECLLTFADWPEDAPLLAKDLAETGFYYLGNRYHVKCFMCDLEVDDWHHGMTALGTHRRRRNNCEIIRAILSTKTSDIQCVNEKWRLQTLHGLTFGSDSDENLCQELAACGFYRFKNTQNIRCAYCGVLIQPKIDSTIMSQHRLLAKQSKKSANLDCLMVRAQCPVNILIPNRKRFPEYREYQSIFTRLDSFDCYKERYKVSEKFLRERAEAGFFLDTMKRMRCFQCGNSLPINDKKLQDRYSQYDIAKLHAHFYPTCEWILEILGFKYVAQVLHDRNKLNDFEHQRSYNTQFSSASSRTTSGSISSISTTPGINDILSPIELISDYSEESDDDNYEPIATPFRAHFVEYISPPLPSNRSIVTPPTDNNPTDIHTESTSPMLMNRINPFKQVALESRSPPMDISHTTDISPIDTQRFFTSEINRLESFKKRNREKFADLKIEELAYAGFYLTSDCTIVQCPWCKVEITEGKFQKILQRRPMIPGSPLNDEPWTAMRVHRHEIGQSMGKDHSWCLWVRREPDEFYPNIIMSTSRMQYPEYPSYSSIEKRIKSFEFDWIYPSGSRLSNLMMADAGFIYLGDGKVCCYYCGNRLYRFEPLDCPFEEHAVYHPLCDYIIQKRGFSYIERVFKESLRPPHAKQKYEMNGTQKIKSIVFDKSGISISKTKRQPVSRINSRLSTKTNRSLSQSTTNTSEIIENDCHLCFENIARYEYEPCRHCPMCGECSVKLTSEQHEECIICRRRAKIAEIHLRVPIKSL